MALGGGIFTSQDKILPGSYINVVSMAVETSSLAARGIAALPCELGWGPDGEVFKVTADEFARVPLRNFGYEYKNEKLKGIRDLFKYAKSCYFYRLGAGGVKAGNTYATALYSGTRGNDIRIVIEPGEGHTSQDPIYDVSTYMDMALVDTQTVKDAAELKPNYFIAFTSSASLALTAGTPLTGGTDGAVSNADHQTALDKLEKYSFNAIGCLSDDATVKGLYAAYAVRMRDEVGMKTQAVIHQYTDADSEAVISIENNTSPDLVYWVTGAAAGCEVNQSLTNTVYNGEYAIKANHTQTQLEDAILAGKFMFHVVGDTINVLKDINTLITYTEEKGKIFRNNQSVRVADQIANDIASLFNTKYLGKIPNDADGRVSFWSDVVKHHQELERIRAIENFSAADVAVEPGEEKTSIVVTDLVTIVNAMEQLYMTVFCQ